MARDVTWFLVRHGSAGSAEAWAGDDLLRPLDGRGRRQAVALVELVAASGASVRRVWSSPYLRCRQTVAPLAASLGLEVETVPELAQGAAVGAGLLGRLPAEDAVLCSHGDVLPELLLQLCGGRVPGVGRPPRCEKGSVWVLSGPAGRPTAARHVPPAR
jgi:phosphohistidine phosphatase SixA